MPRPRPHSPGKAFEDEVTDIVLSMRTAGKLIAKGVNEKWSHRKEWSHQRILWTARSGLAQAAAIAVWIPNFLEINARFGGLTYREGECFCDAYLYLRICVQRTVSAELWGLEEEIELTGRRLDIAMANVTFDTLTENTRCDRAGGLLPRWKLRGWPPTTSQGPASPRARRQAARYMSPPAEVRPPPGDAGHEQSPTPVPGSVPLPVASPPPA